MLKTWPSESLSNTFPFAQGKNHYIEIHTKSKITWRPGLDALVPLYRVDTLIKMGEVTWHGAVLTLVKMASNDVVTSILMG